jgi:hypothetical protein
MREEAAAAAVIRLRLLIMCEVQRLGLGMREVGSRGKRLFCAASDIPEV